LNSENKERDLNKELQDLSKLLQNFKTESENLETQLKTAWENERKLIK